MYLSMKLQAARGVSNNRQYTLCYESWTFLSMKIEEYYMQ